jgi:polyhydroxybutyrate depolymerase
MSRRVAAFAAVVALGLGLGADGAAGTPVDFPGTILTLPAPAPAAPVATTPTPTTATTPTAGATATATTPTTADATTPVVNPAAPPPPPVDPCTTAVTGTGGDENIDMTVDGYARSFRLYVPGPVAAGHRLPVIVAMHGFGDTGKGMERYSGLSALGKRDGFIVAYPNALHGDWAIYSRGPRGTADVDLVRATLGYAETHYCVDRTRIFAVGVSNGGGEASRVACALANRVSAVAIVAGDYRKMPPCQPARPTSIFDIHATSDNVVPYLGTGPTHDGSVPAYLALWRRLDACAAPGVHQRLNADAVRARWTCTDGTAVAQLRLTRGGHFWPGSTPVASAIPGPSSAGAEIWDFFSSLAPRRS